MKGNERELILFNYSNSSIIAGYEALNLGAGNIVGVNPVLVALLRQYYNNAEKEIFLASTISQTLLYFSQSFNCDEHFLPFFCLIVIEVFLFILGLGDVKNVPTIYYLLFGIFIHI